MKIVIVNPLWSFVNYPPVNLAELAAYLIKNGFKNTTITDLNFEIKNKFEIDGILEKSLKMILKQKPQAVCITCNAVQMPFVCELSALIKEKTKIPVIIGGVMASLAPDIILKLSKADFVIRGEGEKTLAELLTGIKNKEKTDKIDGISYLSKNGVIVNHKDRMLMNIDELPCPEFKLISKNLKNSANVWLTASRGCAYKCKFCSGNEIWKMQRRKNPQSIAAQLKILKTKYGIRNFVFGDDCLTLNKKWLKELCLKIKPLRLQWGCLARIDLIDADILKYLYEAGCRHIYHGIESGSAKVRQGLDKKMAKTNEFILDVVKKEIAAGFETTCSFMTGIPFENESDMIKTAELAGLTKKAGSRIQLWLLTPYYGLKMLSEYKNRLVKIERQPAGLQADVFDRGQMFLYSAFIKKYSKYNPDNFMFLPQGMTESGFVKLFAKMRSDLNIDVNKKQLTAKEIFILKNIKQ